MYPFQTVKGYGHKKEVIETNGYTQANGVSFYVLNIIIIVGFLAIAYSVYRSKFRGSFIGTFVSKGTLANPEIWKLTNKKRALYIYETNIPLLITDIVLFLLKAPELYANIIMAIIVLLDFFVIDFIVAVYEEHLEKKLMNSEKTAKITPNIKKRTYTALIIFVAVVIFIILIIHTLGFKVF